MAIARLNIGTSSGSGEFVPSPSGTWGYAVLEDGTPIKLDDFTFELGFLRYRLVLLPEGLVGVRVGGVPMCTLYLANMVMGCRIADKVSHVNGDMLDFRKGNLTLEPLATESKGQTPSSDYLISTGRRAIEI